MSTVGKHKLLHHHRLKQFVQSTAWPKLDLRAGVEQPIDCLIIQNCQDVQSMGRLMDWTWEDIMVNGLICCATLTSHRRGHTYLYKQQHKRPKPVRRRLSRIHAVSCAARNFCFRVAQIRHCSHITSSDRGERGFVARFTFSCYTI